MSFLEHLDEYWHEITAWTALVDLVLAAATICWILAIKKETTSALAWCLLVILLPLLGMVLFVLLGYQHTAELVALLHNSTALLFLNRYETFGLGVIEAMAAGTPVIGTNFTAVPEVVADAGMIVDVGRPREIAEQVVALARGEGLRQKYIELGRRRAAEFTWAACARRLRAAMGK